VRKARHAGQHGIEQRLGRGALGKCLRRPLEMGVDGLPEFAPPYELLNEPGMQQSIGIFGTPEEQQLHWSEEKYE